MPYDPSAAQKAQDAEKAGNTAANNGNFDGAASDYEYAADEYVKAGKPDQADAMRDLMIRALVFGNQTPESMDARADGFDAEALALEARAGAARLAGKMEGWNGASELYEQAAVKRMKAAVLRRAAAVVWKVMTEFRKSAVAASRAAESFSAAAGDWEDAAACEPASDEDEKKAEFRAAEKARGHSIEAHAAARNAFRAAGYNASAGREEDLIGQESDKKDEDFIHSIYPP